VYNHSDLSIECDGDGYYHFTIDFVDSKQDPYTIDVEMQLSIFDEAGAPLVLNDCGDPIDIKEYDIVADKGVIFGQSEDEDGAWWAVEAETDDFYIFLMNGEPGERLDGYYPIEMLDLDECVVAVADPETGDFSEDIKFVGGGISIRVDQVNDAILVIGTLLDEDGNIYHINLTYTDPVADEEQEIVDNEGELKDQTQEEGTFTIFGADNKDNIINITINSDQLEGVFTEADIDYSGSYVFTLSDGIQIIFTANIEVVRNADGSYTITADILCYNNVLYRVRINVPSDVEGFENLNAKEQLKKALENGQVVIIKNGAKYSVTGARL
jgi:hypothetical protein